MRALLHSWILSSPFTAAQTSSAFVLTASKSGQLESDFRRLRLVQVLSHFSPAKSGNTIPSMLTASGIDYCAAFQVHMKDVRAGCTEISKFLDWVYTLDPALSFGVEAIYRSLSTVIPFHSLWRIWAQLNGYKGLG